MSVKPEYRKEKNCYPFFGKSDMSPGALWRTLKLSSNGRSNVKMTRGPRYGLYLKERALETCSFLTIKQLSGREPYRGRFLAVGKLTGCGREPYRGK